MTDPITTPEQALEAAAEIAFAAMIRGNSANVAEEIRALRARIAQPEGDLVEAMTEAMARVYHSARPLGVVPWPEMARAALSVIPQGWRPIETAPRDGTEFWGKVGNDAIAMLWHDEFEAFVSSWRRMTMATGYLIDGKSFKDHSPVVHTPVYWMPIPAAPEKRDEQ